MLGLLLSLPFLFAQGPAPAGGAGAGGGGAAAAPAPAGNANAPAQAPSPLSTLLPLLPIPVLFYFLMIRPQQQQEKKRKAMINQMQRNDRIITAGGIHGTIVGMNTEDDTVTVRVDDDRGVRIVFSKSSIVRVVDSQAERDKDKKAEPAKEV